MMRDNDEYGGYEQRNAPVNVGDELTVIIDAVGEKGDGLAKKDGFVLFVPNTKKGDSVKIRVTRVLKKVGFAEVVGQVEGSQATQESTNEPAQGSQEAPEGSQDGSFEDSDDFGEDDENKEE